MLIGELAEKTGLSRDTVRFYEKTGLIKVHRGQRRANNYKEYPLESIDAIEAIKSLKQCGFTLNEIKEAIGLWESHSFHCEEEKPKLIQRVARIDQQIQELTAIKHRLLNTVESCPHGCEVVKALQVI